MALHRGLKLAIEPPITNPLLTGSRRHRRIAYRVTLSRPFRHDSDTDLIDGVYRDQEGDPIGQIMLDDQPDRLLDTLLVIPLENLPLVHVEAALDADHRITGYEQVFALLYLADERALPEVREAGDRWSDGEYVAYTFESDEEALAAQPAAR